MNPRQKQTLTKILNLWLPLKLQYENIPGAAVSVVKKGEILFEGYFGLKDREQNLPVTKDTQFYIASISKTFTTLAIFQLIEQKQLSLEDLVIQYIPELAETPCEFNNPRTITIRQVLSHSAGFWRDGNTPHWSDNKFPIQSEILESLKNPQVFSIENQTQFKYSNFGYALLGIIIERVSGDNFHMYIEKNIFQKLGLQNTFADFSDEVKNLAKGYLRIIPNEKQQTIPNLQSNGYSPACGIITTLRDFTKVATLFTLPENPILKREQFKAALHPYWPVTPEIRGYGLGFELWEKGKNLRYGHAGGQTGYMSMWQVKPSQDISVIIMDNSLNFSTGAICKGIFEMIDLIEQEKMEGNHYEFQGLYRSQWGDDLVIQSGQNLISCNPRENSPAQSHTKLTHLENHTFKIQSHIGFDNLGELATFKKDQTGTWTMFWGPTPSRKIIDLD